MQDVSFNWSLSLRWEPNSGTANLVVLLLFEEDLQSCQCLCLFGVIWWGGGRDSHGIKHSKRPKIADYSEGYPRVQKLILIPISPKDCLLEIN